MICFKCYIPHGYNSLCPATSSFCNAHARHSPMTSGDDADAPSSAEGFIRLGDVKEKRSRGLSQYRHSTTPRTRFDFPNLWTPTMLPLLPRVARATPWEVEDAVDVLDISLDLCLHLRLQGWLVCQGVKVYIAYVPRMVGACRWMVAWLSPPTACNGDCRGNLEESEIVVKKSRDTLLHG